MTKRQHQEQIFVVVIYCDLMITNFYCHAEKGKPHFNHTSLTMHPWNGTTFYILWLLCTCSECTTKTYASFKYTIVSLKDVNGAICKVVEVREGIFVSVSVQTCDQSSCMDNLRNLLHGWTWLKFLKFVKIIVVGKHFERPSSQLKAWRSLKLHAKKTQSKPCQCLFNIRRYNNFFPPATSY